MTQINLLHLAAFVLPCGSYVSSGCKANLFQVSLASLLSRIFFLPGSSAYSLLPSYRSFSSLWNELEGALSRDASLQCKQILHSRGLMIGDREKSGVRMSDAKFTKNLSSSKKESCHRLFPVVFCSTLHLWAVQPPVPDLQAVPGISFILWCESRAGRVTTWPLPQTLHHLYLSMPCRQYKL